MVSATPDRLLEVAHWLEAAGDTDGARAVLSEGLRWAPEDPRLVGALTFNVPAPSPSAKAELERLLADAAAFTRFGLPEQAFRCLREALQLEPDLVTPVLAASLATDD